MPRIPRVDGGDQISRVILPERRRPLDPAAMKRNMMTTSAIHAFSGGVTKTWLLERVREWDLALQEHRRDLRGKRKRKPVPRVSTETIH